MFGGQKRWRSKKARKVDENILFTRRLFFLRVVFLLLFTILTVQLWRLQIVEGRYYQQKAENNRLRISSVPAPRGVIYDRNGVQLVRNVPSFTVSVVPADLPSDPEKRRAVLQRLSQLMGVSIDEIDERIEERTKQRDLFSPVPIKTNVERTTAFTVEENSYQLPGVKLHIEAVRHYLEGEALAHILGYVGRISAEEYDHLKENGYELNDKIGKTGVELTFESELRGKPGKETIETDANGRKLATLGVQPSVEGYNLVLTIDLDLQKKMREVITQTMGESRYAVAIALNPKTGEVLGMISEPSFDNNLFSRPIEQEELSALLSNPRRPLLNHGISSAFPPGSIFKLVVASAALQEGVARSSTQITSTGAIYVPNQFNPSAPPFVFRDYAALGRLDFFRAIALSSDVYFYYLAGGYEPEKFQGLGIDRLAKYARSFGLGSKTGIALPGETSGLVPDPTWKRRQFKEDWVLGDTYNVGIGQGFLLTSPLQMANVVAAVANGGTLWEPQIVREVVDTKGNVVVPFTRKPIQNVGVEEANLALVRQGMRGAVTYGTARTVSIGNYTWAGKTGTAEFGEQDPITGTYRTAHGWFLGFAPYDDPEIAVMVFHERGRGNETAAPAAAKILQYYLSRPKAGPEKEVVTSRQ